MNSIQKACDLLFGADQVAELRVLKAKIGRGRPATVSGYFSNWEELAKAAQSWDRKAPAIYVTLNPVKPELLARAAQKAIPYAEATTSDQDILRRKWFPIDIDPVRPSGTSSSDEKHEQALEKARKISAWLQLHSWPKPILADSGNGAHLLFRVSEENDEATAQLFSQALQAIAQEFDDDNCTVDVSVFNAARIWKLYGTHSCKGEDLPEYPHRMAQILEIPKRLQLLPREEISAIAKRLKGKAPTTKAGKKEAILSKLQQADPEKQARGVELVEQFLERHEVPFSREDWRDGAIKFSGIICPWKEGTEEKKAWVVVQPSGWISAGCQHASCKGKGWPEMVQAFEPEIQIEVVGSGEDLQLSGNDKGPHNNLDNCVTILEHHPQFQGQISYDSFHQKIFYTGQQKREWTDNDTLIVTQWIQRNLIPKMSDETVFKAVRLVAQRNQRHEVKEWLEGLEWDGQQWLEDLGPVGFGCEYSEYVIACFTNFIVGMVSRAMEAGSKMDNMIILEGRQGAGKSTALAILGGKWHAELNESVTSKDFYLALQGKWLVEIAELDSFSKAESTRIKQIITQRTDRFRAPFERNTRDWPRSCVFAGSTNENRYLKDITGGRRFWPVACGTINFEWLKEHREQIFAQGLQYYLQGHEYWEMPQSTQEEQERRRIRHPWEDEIEAEFGEQEGVWASQIHEFLQIDISRNNPGFSRKIHEVMTKLGFHSVRKRNPARSGREAYFEKVAG